jgi:hypothetical protein
VPPRGVWGRTSQVTTSTVESWLGRSLAAEPSIDEVVVRYLAAFGPATVRDAQAWSGLRGLSEVFARLDLEELGDGYFDLPGAPRPDAETPAPVRFLPRFDDVLISFADRSRFGEVVIGQPTILVDGLVAGTWRWTGDDVEVSLRRAPREVDAERRRLRDWLAS